jgi:hypothetical protein
MTGLTRFRSDQRGAVAVVFGVMLIPVLGIAGMALDYNRASSFRANLQAKADAAALNAAINGSGLPHSQIVADMRTEVEGMYGGIANLAVGGEWITDVDFRVTATGRVDTAMIHIVPGIDRGLDVTVEAVARVAEQEVQYDPPVLSELEPDAGDYNQIYAYCFDYKNAGTNDQQAWRYRSQMTLIADNDGGSYNFEWPSCGEGESLSFRMRNVRHAKAYPNLWNNPTQWPYRAEFDYFTDTVVVDGVEHIDIRREIEWVPSQWQPHYASGHVKTGFEMLETIRCDSLAECSDGTPESILPSGKNRTPQTETRGCEPGKYMYFGWEDRPPDQPGPNSTWTDPSWTDRSYDDIRIVMKCPDGGAVGDRLVRLIR